jgi:hypothetical protein
MPNFEMHFLAHSRSMVRAPVTKVPARTRVLKVIAGPPRSDC